MVGCQVRCRELGIGCGVPPNVAISCWRDGLPATKERCKPACQSASSRCSAASSRGNGRGVASPVRVEAQDKPVDDLNRDISEGERARGPDSLVQAMGDPIATIHEEVQFSS